MGLLDRFHDSVTLGRKKHTQLINTCRVKRRGSKNESIQILVLYKII